MLEGGYNLTGFRVCVSWLPSRGNVTHFTNTPVAHVLAEFTYLSIGPVNTNPTCNFIPKNEIIWHMRSPTFADRQAGAYQQCRRDQKGEKRPADVIRNGVIGPGAPRPRGKGRGAKRPPRRAACHLPLGCQLVCKSAAVELRGGQPA